ncbi:MAG TPA: hypothetical protein VEV20_12505 [Burkholderiales bacterium]|nr:hypothetical protein [Burkholderiales bacterium]
MATTDHIDTWCDSEHAFAALIESGQVPTAYRMRYHHGDIVGRILANYGASADVEPDIAW